MPVIAIAILQLCQKLNYTFKTSKFTRLLVKENYPLSALDRMITALRGSSLRMWLLSWTSCIFRTPDMINIVTSARIRSKKLASVVEHASNCTTCCVTSSRNENKNPFWTRCEDITTAGLSQCMWLNIYLYHTSNNCFWFILILHVHTWINNFHKNVVHDDDNPIDGTVRSMFWP